jgi:hypothetical protein
MALRRGRPMVLRARAMRAYARHVWRLPQP